jgi:hypothetical protein
MIKWYPDKGSRLETILGDTNSGKETSARQFFSRVALNRTKNQSAKFRPPNYIPVIFLIVGKVLFK